MNDTLFDTEDKKANAVLHFQALEVDLGWQLVVRIVQANIDILKQHLIEGAEGQTLDDVRRLRDKIRDHQDFINTPKNMIERLSAVGVVQTNEDPYDQSTSAE